jgi:opacity protein-like surface antigen
MFLIPGSPHQRAAKMKLFLVKTNPAFYFCCIYCSCKPITTMKQPLFLILLSILLPQISFAQLVAFNAPRSELQTQMQQKTNHTKAASYTSLGYQIPLGAKDIIVGGNTMVYRKFGTFIGYNVGIQNFLMPTKGERGEFKYANVEKNGWTITGNTEQSTAFIFNGGLTIALAKRLPLYLGAGVTRYREFFEYIDPTDNKPKWNVNDDRTRMEINYTAGLFVPLFGRLVMNIGYNHNPQTVFVGLAISSPTNFEDADDWWWGN